VCGWQVKLCYTQAISKRFIDKELTYKALYKFSCFSFNIQQSVNTVIFEADGFGYCNIIVTKLVLWCVLSY